MRILKGASVFFILLFLFFSTNLTPTNAFERQRLLVKFKHHVLKQDRVAILSRVAPGFMQDTIENRIEKLDIFQISLPNVNASQVITALKKTGLVDFVEPDAKASKVGTTDDTSLSVQWGLYKTQVASSSAQSAWDLETGNTSIKVAVLDTGIDETHPELASQIVDKNNFTNTSSSIDADGHGSHVSGVIAAVGNNSSGIAGICYKCQLLNGKVLDDTGSGYYSWIANGIVWATDSGAKVINMSLGGSTNSQTLLDAVNYAISHDVVVVAAAGNSGSSIKFYPAGFGGVISVGATNENDVKPYWSNYGNWVMVAGPGTNIYSTYKNGGYQTMQGTSMATPFVSGVAALIWSHGNCPDSACVVQTLENTADHVAGSGSQFKYGRVNALGALGVTSSPTPSVTPTPTSDPTTTPTENPTPTITPTQAPSVTPTPTQVASNVIHVDSISASYIKNNFSYKLTFKVKIKDENGNPINRATVAVSVTSPTGIKYGGSGSTNSSGDVSFSITAIKQSGNYTMTVTSVNKSGYSFDTTGNVKVLNIP